MGMGGRVVGAPEKQTKNTESFEANPERQRKG